MRIFLSAVIIILGANLMIDLLDSNMLEMINERNESIEKTIKELRQFPSSSELRYAANFVIHQPQNMSTTSFCNGQSWSKFDSYYSTEYDDERDTSEGAWQEDRRGVAEIVPIV